MAGNPASGAPARSALFGGVKHSAKAAVQQPLNSGLVGPTWQQIYAAKEHIVALASQRAYIQSHIDQLEADLAKIDPADVARVVVPGYPLTH